MIKRDRIEKLYQELTNKEKAMLAFQYMVGDNETEVDKISSAVPWENYRCPNMEYRNWLNGIFHIAHFWGVAYWKLHFQRTAALACTLADTEGNRFGGMEKNIAWVKYCESCLLALDNALIAICTMHGIDVESMRNQVGATASGREEYDVVADAECQEQMQRQLESFILGWDKIGV